MKRYVLNQGETMVIDTDSLGMVWVDYRSIYAKLYTKNDDVVSIDKYLSGGVLGHYTEPDIAERVHNDFVNWLVCGDTNKEYAFANFFSFPVWDSEKKCLKSFIPVA